MVSRMLLRRRVGEVGHGALADLVPAGTVTAFDAVEQLSECIDGSSPAIRPLGVDDDWHRSPV